MAIAANAKMATLTKELPYLAAAPVNDCIPVLLADGPGVPPGATDVPLAGVG